MSDPTHYAFVIIDPPRGSKKKAVWRRVGAAWPAKTGNGLMLVIDDQISVTGRIAVIERKEDEPEPAMSV